MCVCVCVCVCVRAVAFVPSLVRVACVRPSSLPPMNYCYYCCFDGRRRPLVDTHFAKSDLSCCRRRSCSRESGGLAWCHCHAIPARRSCLVSTARPASATRKPGPPTYTDHQTTRPTAQPSALATRATEDPVQTMPSDVQGITRDGARLP